MRGLVERLTRQEQLPQRRQIVFLEESRVLLLQHTHRGGCGEHHADLIFLDDLPPDACIRAQRRTFVHDRCHATDERTVDDVAVANHPADVRGREHGFARVAGKDVLHRRRQGDAITTRVTLHALGLAGGA